ncbi:MAG: LPS export ABC transporter permease LptF, partial [Burkholderiales bacterium]
MVAKICNKVVCFFLKYFRKKHFLFLQIMVLRHYTYYILKVLALPTLAITLVLTGIIWLTQSLRFIDLILNRGLELSTFLYITLLLLPLMLSITLPVALFCSVIHGYHKLIMDSEMVVMQGAGLSRAELAKPALLLATIVMVISYFLSLYLLPTSYREFKDIQAHIKENYASLLLQEGVFNTPMKGLTVYIEEQLENDMLKGILVHDNRIADKPSTMMAQQGTLRQTDHGPQLTLLSGNRQEINRNKGQLSLLYFDQYDIDLSQYTKHPLERWREPQERYLSELFFPQDTKNSHVFNKLLAEGHQRLVWPIYNIILACIAVACLLTGEFNRRGQWRRIGKATVAGIAIIMFHITLISLATTYLWAGAGVYVIALGGLLIS